LTRHYSRSYSAFRSDRAFLAYFRKAHFEETHFSPHFIAAHFVETHFKPAFHSSAFRNAHFVVTACRSALHFIGAHFAFQAAANFAVPAVLRALVLL
jgi:hypothetical protein